MNLLSFANIVFLFSSFYNVWGILPKYERLPNDTRPISYDLHIIKGMHNRDVDFNGTVQILLEAVNDTNRIVIHAKDFTNIKLNLLELDSKKEFKDLEYEFDVAREQMVITSASEHLGLTAGKEYILSISYEAKLCTGLKGFCLISYQDSDGNPALLATSHLSRGFTRTVFPCYDEPALKARFTFSITHDRNYTALSNMPAAGDPIESGEGLVTTKFKETPPMSTYIVAFAISNYAHISERVENTTVRLFYPPNAKGGQLSFDVAKKVLPLMNDYFESAYPLPKLDHFSSPALAARGMENWGLIIYQESVVLADFDDTKYDISFNMNTVTHEMAHNWFGNLVTPAWWSYYWLSEGISSFYGPKFLDMVKPEWKIMETMVGTRFGSAVWDYPDQCSLTCHAETGSEFSSFFGLQSYGKGAFLMRMFENTLTESTFRRGIIKYLKNYQYSSATEDDFFNSLQEAVDESTLPFFRDPRSLNKAMKSWTNQKFYPLVTVTRDYERNTFGVTQINFRDRSTENMNLWWIPITFTTASSSDFENTTVDFIIPGERSMEVDPYDFNKTLLDNDWLIVNKEQFGMYRVNYDESNWQLIICALLKDPKIFPPYTRAQIVRDVSALFREGLMPDLILLRTLSYLKKEIDPVPWDEALKLLTSIYSDLDGDDNQDNFKNFTADLVDNVFNELGTENKNNDIPMTKSIRTHIFSLACSVGLEKCVQAAKYIAAANESEKTHISSNMVAAAYCQSIKYGDEDNFKEMVIRFVENNEYTFLRNASPCSENKDNLRFLLNRTMNSDYFRNILYNLETTSAGLSVIIEMIGNGEVDEYNDVKHYTKFLIYSATSSQQRDQIIKINEKFGNTYTEETLNEVDANFGKIQKQKNIFSKLFKNLDLSVNFECSKI